MEEKFDIKSLQSRIAEVKQEQEVSNNFTQEFLECLLKRHDLKNLIVDDQNFQDVPDSIIEDLKEGIVPSIEKLSVIDVITQDYFLKDCVWLCGMASIAFYSDNNIQYLNQNPKPFDEIIKMPQMSAAHHSASYIVAALTLLMGDIPSQEIIATLTNNFDESDDQLEKNVEFYNELCVSILRRYQEDQEYYFMSEEE